MVRWRRPWLGWDDAATVVVSVLFLLTTISTASASITDGDCYQDDLVTPVLTMGAGGFDPDSFSVESCLDICWKLGLPYAAVSEAIYCFCISDTSSLTTASSDLCDLTCSNGDACGGSVPVYMTLYETIALTGSIIFTLDSDTISQSEAVTATVTASGTWVMDWGDGTAPGINVSTHTYSQAGFFTVTGYLEALPSIIDERSVTVMEAPTAEMECPIVMVVGEEGICKVSTALQGDDNIATVTFADPGVADVTCNVPGGVLSMYGSTLGDLSVSSSATLEVGKAILLDKDKAKAGEVAKIDLDVQTAGTAAIYAIRPWCDSGEFCSHTDDCSASCSDAAGVYSCTDWLCVHSQQCSSAQCASGTPKTDGAFKYRLLGSIPVTTTGAYTHPVDEEEWPVYDDEQLAIGCLESADCSGSPLTLNCRDKSPPEWEDHALDFSETSKVVLSQNMSAKHLAAITLRHHPVVDLDYHFTCSAPSVLATDQVPTPYTSDTATYLEEGGYDMTYKLQSTRIGDSGAWQNLTSVLCQSPVGIPDVVTEQWVPWNIETSFIVTFKEGSPAFSSLLWGPDTSFVYFDDAASQVWVVPLLYPDTGDFTLTGNVSNLISTESYTSLIHVVPPVTDNWVATVLCLCLDTEEGFNTTLDLPAQDYPPWTATVSSWYDDEMLNSDDEQDFGTSTNNGVSEALSFTVHSKILTAGNYTLKFVLTNEVSNTTITAPVEIKEGLRGVTAKVTWDQKGVILEGLGPNGNSYMYNSTIFFEPSSLTGESDKWRLTLSPSGTQLDLTENGTGILTCSFEEEGDYEVIVSGYNEVQKWVDSDPIPLNILKQIQDYVLTDDGEATPPNISKPVFASFGILPPLSCLMVQWELNGEMETYGYETMCRTGYPSATYSGTLTNPVTLEHTYSQEGIYEVETMAFDSTVQIPQRLTLYIVNELPCKTPNVTIVERISLPYQAKETFKSLQVETMSDADVQCNKTVPIDRWWTVAKVDRMEGHSIQDIDIKHILPSWNYSVLVIPPRFLDVGSYRLDYFIRINASKLFPLERSAFSYIAIIPSPLQAVITEGSVRSMSRGYGQRISLDPCGLSTDPDDLKDKDFNVTWWCRQINKSEEHPMNEGNLMEYNEHDLPLPYAEKNITNGGCFGMGPGVVRMPSDKIDLPTNLFVSPSGTYEIEVKISKGGRVAFAAVTVEVMQQTPPTVLIKCIEAAMCVPYQGALLINPSVRLALTGACIADCATNMTYAWTILDGNGEQVNETEVECPEPEVEGEGARLSADTCDKVFLTDKTKKDLAINSKFFTENNPKVQKFRFKLTITTPTESRGYAENLVILNQAPTDGTCVVDKVQGYSLIDDFRVICEAWKDPEDMGIDSYSFYIIINEDGKITKKTMISSSKADVEIIFPVGYFELRCEILDKFSAFKDVYINHINVTMPSQAEVDNFNLTDQLDYLNSIGDQTRLAMMLIASGSVKDNADWLSLDVSSFENMTQEETLQRIREIALMNKESLQLALNTMGFATLPQINVGVGVLQAAVEGALKEGLGASTVDMATREAALDLMDKMAEEMDSVKINSPQELKPFLSSSMTSMSAIMKTVNSIIDDPSIAPITDQEAAVDWDYEVDIGDDIDLEVPTDRATQLHQNVLDTTRLKSKLQVDRMMAIVEKMAVKVLNKSVVGEMVTAQSEGGATIMIAKITEEIMKDGMLIDPQDGHNASVAFPRGFCPSRYLLENTDCKQEAGISITVWPGVTHVFSATKRFLTNKTKVINIDVFVKGVKIDVSNESLPITITVPRKLETRTEKLLVNASDCLNSRVPFVYHTFNVSKQFSAFSIEISPFDTDLPELMVMLIDFERMPTPSKFESIHYVNSLPLSDNGSFVYFLNTEDNDNREGRFFIAMALLKEKTYLKRMLDTELNLKRTDFDESFDSQYVVHIHTFGCYFFDDLRQEWSGIGINIRSLTPTSAVCDANHLTPFGSGFFPTPNTIDFDYVFANIGFLDNLTVYTVLFVLLCCYIVMLIWARIMDRKDIEHRGVIPLEDNEVEDRYLYEITFTTGPDKQAGTNSNIQFIVSGEYDETEVRILPPPDGKRYHRYSVDAFVMSTFGPLGDISYLRVWHDNSGIAPFDTWQLQTVVIRDLQTRAKHIFFVNSWLAFDRDHGTVDLLLKPSENEHDETYSDTFYNKGNRNANEDHMYLSIFLRPTGSRFSRMERVSVATLFLYLCMVLSAMWYQRLEESPLEPIVDIGPIVISVEQLIIGVLAAVFTYPVTLILTVIFKRARPYKLRKCRALEAIAKQRREQLDMDEDSDDSEILNQYDLLPSDKKNRSKDTNKVKCIPWWTRWLAWLIALAGIGISIFIVWSYGITWGETKTIKWFSSFIISFVISFLVTQWLKVFILTSIGTLCCKSMDMATEDIDCDEELPRLKYDEEWKNVKPMDSSFERKVLRVGGVDSKEPKVAILAAKLRKNREMGFVMRDIGVYCLFLVVVFILVEGRTDYNAFLLQSQMTNAFIKIGHREFDFSAKVISANHFWHWTHKIIMTEIRAQRWYNNEPPYGLRGFIGDRLNRILGFAILRQVRSNPDSCRVNRPFREVIRNCSGGRTTSHEETRHFCAGWRLYNDSSDDCFFPEYMYQSEADLETYPQYGKLGSYSGAGYVLPLKGPQNDIISRMKLLQKKNWIDRYTRAVMLEFAVYNANVNLFVTCSVLAEFDEGGGITPNWRFEPLRLLPNSGLLGFAVTVAEWIFVIVTVIFTLREFWKMKKEKCSYFASYWNIAEICIIVISYTAIGMYVYRYFVTQIALDKFKETYGNGYVRIDKAALIDQIYLYLLSTIVFFSTLKLIKLLQFNKRMNVLALTIRRCWDELKIFFIAFGIIFFAFCCLFYFVFITSIEDFAHFISAVETSFKMLLGKFNFEEMNRANAMSPVLFFSFSVMNSMILINIMLTIIIRAFNEVKTDLEKRANKYDVVDYVWSQFRLFLRMDQLPDNSVDPNVLDKKKKECGGADQQNTEELPDKVNKLMAYIGEVYFDGKLDMNDSMVMKKAMRSMSSKSYRPYTSKFSKGPGDRHVFNSD